MGHSPNEKDDFRMTGRPEAKIQRHCGRVEMRYRLFSCGNRTETNCQLSRARSQRYGTGPCDRWSERIAF